MTQGEPNNPGLSVSKLCCGKNRLTHGNLIKHRAMVCPPALITLPLCYPASSQAAILTPNGNSWVWPMLSADCALALVHIISLPPSLQGGAMILSIIRIRKLSLGEVKQLSQGPHISKWGCVIWHLLSPQCRAFHSLDFWSQEMNFQWLL